MSISLAVPPDTLQKADFLWEYTGIVSSAVVTEGSRAQDRSNPNDSRWQPAKKMLRPLLTEQGDHQTGERALRAQSCGLRGCPDQHLAAEPSAVLSPSVRSLLGFQAAQGNPPALGLVGERMHLQAQTPQVGCFSDKCHPPDLVPTLPGSTVALR